MNRPSYQAQGCEHNELSDYLKGIETRCVQQAQNLFRAISATDTQTIVRLVRENHKLLRAQGNGGMCPLSIAASDGNLSSVETLLASGADPNAPDGNGEGSTPMHWAVCANRKDILLVLLHHGGNCNAKDYLGMNLLSRAKVCHQKEMEEFLKAHGAVE